MKIDGIPKHASLSANWARQKLPTPILVISLIGVPIVFIAMLGAVATKNLWGVFITASCGVMPWLFLYTNATGQKLAWDDQGVYMRPPGWDIGWRPPWLTRLPWRSLRYDEIVSLDGMTVNDPSARSKLLPFQLLRLTAPGTDDDFDQRHLWLYSLSLRDKDLAPLLRQLDAKCPGMLPKEVQDRLATWADNDR